jgi:hypothetical protein
MPTFNAIKLVNAEARKSKKYGNRIVSLLV